MEEVVSFRERTAFELAAMLTALLACVATGLALGPEQRGVLLTGYIVAAVGGGLLGAVVGLSRMARQLEEIRPLPEGATQVQPSWRSELPAAVGLAALLFAFLFAVALASAESLDENLARQLVLLGGMLTAFGFVPSAVRARILAGWEARHGRLLAPRHPRFRRTPHLYVASGSAAAG